MITLVLTNRERDLRLVKNSLQSLHNQTCSDYVLFLVDYGSSQVYKSELKNVLKSYPQVKYIECPVEGQLWNKCRAINIVLKQTKTRYFLVGDIDLVYSSVFIQEAKRLARMDEVHYFQYGFLSREESSKNKDFESYHVHFKGTEEVTGTTLFPTSILKSVNGYDEFYHGWGAEDTDVHNRLKNFGLNVFFYDEEILVKHQWHPKVYRSKRSKYPFHSNLEQINHAYMLFSLQSKITIVNQNLEWGVLPKMNQNKILNSPNHFISIKPIPSKINSVIAQITNFNNQVIDISVSDFSSLDKMKNTVQKFMGRKYKSIYKLEKVNNMLLEAIIKQFRNAPYFYIFNREKKFIQLRIYLT